MTEEELIEVAFQHAPMLQFLLQDRGQAASAIVEWDGGKNYCQIQRDTFELNLVDREAALIDHVRCLHAAVLYGHAKLDVSGTQPVGYVGGLNELHLAPADAQLLFMRGPMEIPAHGEGRNEFLSEFTVVPRDRA